MLQFALLSSMLLATPEDAPVAEPASEPTPAAEAKTTPASVVPREPLGWGYHYAAGAAAAIVFVPVSLYFGQWLGSLSNDLIGAALPVLLSIGLIPPIAVTLATVLVGNWSSPGRHKWWPAFLATMIINGVSLPIAASMGLSAGLAGRVIVYTLVQAVLQPGAAVLLERAWPNMQPTVISLVSDPVAPRTFVVPTGSWSF